MAPLGATPKTTLPSSSSWRASTLASPPSWSAACLGATNHTRSQAMITIVKQVSHMRGCLTLGRVSQPVQAGRQARAALAGWMSVTGEVGGSMAKWRHVTRKAAYCCPSFLFFSRAHTRKSQWVVTVTKYHRFVLLCSAHLAYVCTYTLQCYI